MIANRCGSLSWAWVLVLFLAGLLLLGNNDYLQIYQTIGASVGLAFGLITAISKGIVFALNWRADRFPFKVCFETRTGCETKLVLPVGDPVEIVVRLTPHRLFRFQQIRISPQRKVAHFWHANETAPYAFDVQYAEPADPLIGYEQPKVDGWGGIWLNLSEEMSVLGGQNIAIAVTLEPISKWKGDLGFSVPTPGGRRHVHRKVQVK